MQRLVSMLQQAEEYVGTVVDGKLTADPHMGRKVRQSPIRVGVRKMRFLYYLEQLGICRWAGCVGCCENV